MVSNIMDSRGCLGNAEVTGVRFSIGVCCNIRMQTYSWKSMELGRTCSGS